MKKYFSMRTSLVLFSLWGLAFTLGGCTSSSGIQPAPPPPSVSIQPTPPVPKPQPEAVAATPVKKEQVDLSQKSQSFIDGKKDGCATAKGRYTKDSARYNGDSEYNEGWFYGRRSCQAH